MKKRTRIITLLLALIIAFGSFSNFTYAANENLGNEANDKRVKFGVLSDIHVGGDKNDQAKRTEDSIRKLKELGAEAVFINGDITEWGRRYEYKDLKKVLDKFKAEGYPVYANMGNHDFLTLKNEKAEEIFRNTTGNEPNATYEINGYQFVMVSPEKTGYVNFANDNYDKANAYLETALKDASEKSKDKPIFVFAHHPVPNTYYSSESWAGQLQKTPFLNYPNVVLFGGHNHPTNQLPNMIWQDEFTAVSVPSIQYQEFPVIRKPEGSYDQMQGLIVEAEGDKVNVKTWDFRANMWTNQEWEFNANGEKIYKDMKSKVKAPSFNGNEDVVKIETTEDSVSIEFKQPKTPEGELVDNPVYRYYYELSENGKLPYKTDEINKFYVTPIPETITKSFKRLKPNANYTLTIQGEDIFGNKGEPLKVEFHTSDSKLEPNPLPTEGGSVKFGVISDTHVKQGEDIRNKERTRNALNFMKKEDTIATFIVGDVTDQGREGEYINLKEVLDDIRSDGYTVHLSIGNHDAAKNLFDKNKYNERFTNFTGETPNAHHIINGYHFIMVSPDTDADNSYRLKTKNYLRDELNKAKQDTGNKPIFVFMHHPVKDTFYVSEEWNQKVINKDFFKDYPMAVVFSGHIHSPNNHPRSIWQGSKELNQPVFTSVNTVTLNYFEMEKGYSNGDTSTYPYLHEEGQQGLVVEADGSLVTIKNYDFRSNQWIEQVWTFDTADTVNFPYTDKRYSESKAPYFENEDDVKLSVEDNNLKINITQAKVSPESVNGDIVHSYELELYRGEIKDRTTKIWSNFHLIPMPENVEFTLDNLNKDTFYKLVVTPVNAFKVKGEPIVKTFDTFNRSTITFNVDSEKGTTLGENIIVVSNGSNLEDIKAPEVKANEGYRFIGWDRELVGKVESDITLNAKLEEDKKNYEVIFIIDELKGSTTDELKYLVEEGTELKDIKVPEVKANEGYIFTGWDRELVGKVDSDLLITANFIEIENPVDPEKPTPDEPEKPSPVEPEKPSPVEPEKPTPVEPEKPTPVEPEKPTPVEPEKPTPVEPEKPTPVEPEKPTPVEPEKPTPVEPEKPTPVEPEKPTPVEPEKPTPVEPEKPTPVDPEKPTPVKPTNPVKPVLPERELVPKYQNRYEEYNPFTSYFINNLGRPSTPVSTKVTEFTPTPPFSNVENTITKPVITDISGHWAENVITTVVEKGYMDLDNGKFMPNVDATRLTYVKALAKMAGVNPKEYMNKTVFTDVVAGTTDAGYINWAYEKGIVKGTGDGKFEGVREISRQEIATILNRYTDAMDIKLDKKEEKPFADDDKIADWAKADVKEARQKGIFNGKDENIFDPLANITRAEVAQVVVNMDK